MFLPRLIFYLSYFFSILLYQSEDGEAGQSKLEETKILIILAIRQVSYWPWSLDCAGPYV
jgi:hypothetical protein